MQITTSIERETELVAFTIIDDDGEPVTSRVVSVAVAVQVCCAFFDVAAAARSRGERTVPLDLDKIIETAASHC